MGERHEENTAVTRWWGFCLTSAHWKPVAVPIALKLNFAWRCFELIVVLVILVVASLTLTGVGGGGTLATVAATLA